MLDSTTSQKDFILGADLRTVMWRLALPAIAAMVLFGLNAFMDTVYIGQLLNETALAGAALAYPLTGVTMGLGSWAGTGAGNLLSIALGKEDVEDQARALPNLTLFVLVTSLLFAVPAYMFAEPLIRLMGGSGDILEYGVRYLSITLLAAPLWVYGLALNFVVRAEGKMKQAAVMMAYGLGVNLILTPLLIVYGGLGVEGAAWATNVGMLVYCLVGYFYFRRGRASFIARVSTVSYDGATFAAIAKLGFPGFILSVMGLIQAIVTFNAIVGVGTDDDLAFFAAANRIVLFLMTPLFGLMRALQPVVGINYGADQYGRVKKSLLLFVKTGLYLVAPFWCVLTIFPKWGLLLVLPEATFTAVELNYFRIYLLVLPLLPLVFMSLTYLPAIGQPKWASIVGSARQLVFYIPVMLLLPKIVGIGGIYYGATAIDLVITAWLAYLVYRSFRRLPAET
ncbi:MAG: MATE family efflux transporter [Bacteroidota bacterium]